MNYNEEEYAGLFIVFEGIDGSGKTTQALMLKEFFDAQGILCSYFREPGGTSLGEKVREIVLHTEMSPRAELMLFLASRAELVETEVMPKLRDGEVVILDRYKRSSIVYQGGFRELGFGVVDLACNIATHGLLPDITFFIDVPEQVAFQRLRSKDKDKFENMGLDILRRTREYYFNSWENEFSDIPVIIKGEGNEQDISLEIINQLNRRVDLEQLKIISDQITKDF